MLPWIQVYSNLTDHPKIYALVDRMNLRRNCEAVGVVVTLWLWAAKNAPDGDLSGFPKRAIADAVGYSSSYAGKLCKALVETRWLDEKEGGGYLLHDWAEYAALLIDITERKKHQAKVRMRRLRAQKDEMELEDDSVTCYANKSVTLRGSYALTGQDRTEQNKTIVRREEESSSSWSKSKLISLFSPKLQLSESTTEELLSVSEGMEEALLLKSLDIAQDNGKLNWGYVRGILRNWRKNGVKTLREFEEREARRKVNPSGGSPARSAPGAQDVAESRRRMEELRKELEGEKQKVMM